MRNDLVGKSRIHSRARRRTGRDDRKKENGAGRSRAVGIR
jgi:hypothetical protein